MSLLEAKLIDTVSLVSMSSKLTVPLSLRFCALALSASVKPAEAVALTVGLSLVPVMVKLTMVVGRRHRVGEGDGLARRQEVEVGAVDRVAPGRGAGSRRVAHVGVETGH